MPRAPLSVGPGPERPVPVATAATVARREPDEPGPAVACTQCLSNTLINPM